MAGNSGTPIFLVLAAVILGGSIVGGSLLIRSSLEAGRAELAGVRATLGELREAVEPPAPPSRQAARPNRPDPNKRYQVSTEGSPAIGPADAEVTLVAFSDFQCPFCARVTPTLEKVEEEYGEQVRIVFKHLPLGMHSKAPAAHAAAEAAHLQGKFWEMHDKIFGNQAEMSPEKYLEYAEELGLDLARFERDLADPAIQQRIDQDIEAAERLSVRGTPSFFLNGRFFSGAQPFEAFQERIEEELGEG